MTIPNHQDIMLPLLQALEAYGDMRGAELLQRMTDHFSLDEEARATLVPSGKQSRMAANVQWAGTYLAQAGLVERPARGVLRLSEAGGRLLAEKPARVDNKLLYQLGGERFRRFMVGGSAGASPAPAAEAVQEPAALQDQVDQAAAGILADLRIQLLEQLQKISPAFFERLIVDLMLAMGYGFDESGGRQLGGSGDGGVDGEIYEDKLGLDRILLQAKRYAPESAIGSPQIREFIGSLDVQGVSKGVFVTTSRFSEEAKRIPRHGGKRLVLIDGARLADLMIEHGVGVRVERKILIKALDLNYFEDV